MYMYSSQHSCHVISYCKKATKGWFILDCSPRELLFVEGISTELHNTCWTLDDYHLLTEKRQEPPYH